MRWKLLDQPHTENVAKLASAINADRISATLLLQRGINDFNSAKDFFRPTLDLLHDPFLMKDMDKAVARILSAIDKKEKILVYGDYDVDGTTSVALFYSYLVSIGAQAGYYIPDRYGEGYGISFKGIDFAKENNYALVVSLDCGIKANEKIDYANEKGVDFIICDHHLPGDHLPKAFAVLDPKRNDCPYPYKELSGCGVGFKLAQAIHKKLDKATAELVPYLDLVAISIAADIVAITGENRVLCYFGLQEVNKLKRPGIKALYQTNKLKKELTVADLVFVIAPRINAAGRIDHAMRAAELLLSTNEEEAEKFAGGINQTNTNRKDIDQGMTAQALEMIDADLELIGKKTTVIYNEGWHKGVVGIVASRLIEKYYRPTIVLTKSDGMLTGSARSVKKFDIYTAIESCADLLEQFGGHRHAAGLTLKPENLDEFTRRFEAEVDKNITEEMLVRELDIDVKINFNEIDQRFFSILQQFAPHGPGNMTPVFCTENVADTGWARVVGNNHLKLELFQMDNPTIKFHAIAFDKGDFLPFFQKKMPLNVCYSVAENHYNGKTTLQLVVRDIQLS
ncbi:MAG TPA: single-stranded-DNA-specific exonuclease RecJ [Bacteroidia bacterium]|jgi:single-stranded-DNA-specific exonuclease|nr:single-stranded-DNA-specific exonuclease RecJ [Bacteroidia bacterium]